jgi:hypothetical protein
VRAFAERRASTAGFVSAHDASTSRARLLAQRVRIVEQVQRGQRLGRQVTSTQSSGEEAFKDVFESGNDLREAS